MLLPKLAPEDTGPRSGMQGWDPAKDSLWLIVPADEWTTAYRLMAQDNEMVVAELRKYPTDKPGNYILEPGEWSQEPSTVPARGLHARDLRFPFGRWRGYARDNLQSVRHAIGEEQFEALFVGRTMPIQAIEQLAEPPSRRKRWNDYQHAVLAAQYAAIVESGERKAVKVLAEKLGYAVDTVRDLVHETRRRGLLTPTGQGVAGGRLTPRAEQILNDKGEEQ